MKLEYMGPKAMISEHGIAFKEGKEDKYVYLNNALQIYNAINHDYEKKRVYHHNITTTTYTPEEIMTNLQNNIQDFEATIENEMIAYDVYLQEQEDNVQQHQTLTKEEKNTFINNLNIMKPYRKQRFINKHAYEHLIKAITNKIVTHQLQEIQTPFNERFWHILQTLQGWLSKEHTIDSTVETVHQDDKMFIFFHINKRY